MTDSLVVPSMPRPASDVGLEVPLQIDDVALWTVLRYAVDNLDTELATIYAISQGVRPPGDEGPWSLVLDWDPQGQPPPGRMVWWQPARDDGFVKTCLDREVRKPGCEGSS